MKKMIDLNDLMEEQLRNMFDGENRLIEALPKFYKNATDQRLKQLLEDYQEKCENQIMRLRQAFNLLYTQKRGEKCDALKALIKEGEELMSRSMDPMVMDAGIITGIQHIIHYQVAGYGAISNYANVLELPQVAALTHQNLEEQKETDRKLANLAEEAINIKAKNVIKD